MSETMTKPKIKIKKPSLYNVILHNDDVTPFDYVIMILMSIFGKSYEESYEITKNIHTTKGGIAGTFSKEVALEKVHEIKLVNSNYNLNLQSSIEEE